MTPGIDIIKASGMFYQIHEYEHKSSNTAYGLEAVEKMGVAAAQVFKTLVLVNEKKENFVAILPVTPMLSMKLAAKACASKKLEMADKSMVQRSTGYVLGGVSPLGQKKKLITVLDSSALNYKSIFVSAGRRGLEIELDPRDLMTLTNAKTADIIQV